MKKLLLLDADVVIDLHSLGLFEKLAKSCEIKIVRKVFQEARYFPRGNRRIAIDIADEVSLIEDISIESLEKVFQESKEARLTIDPGEAQSIAYLIEAKEDIEFCACDKAAIILMSYMEIEDKAISLEKALRRAGYHRKLLPRHLELYFKDNVRTGKALRIQFKKLI